VLALVWIGNVYYFQQKYDESLPWYRRALAIREKQLGNEHPDVAITLERIAGVFDGQKKYD